MARQADLLSVEDARRRILHRFHRLESELVPLEAALGRVLGEPVDSSLDLPPFANSSMDGFALHSASTAMAAPAHPAMLRLVEHIPAGSVGRVELGPGTCARIMTGAPLPPGADAVVPFEEVEDRVTHILLSAPVGPRACVRPAGQDVRSSQTVLDPGIELAAPQVGMLAALGLSAVPVVRRPVVGVLSTGNELVNPGERLEPGQIYNSNGPMLAAAIREAGGIVHCTETAGDDRETVAAALRAVRVRGADLLITSGGASVGDFDFVTEVIGSTGELTFWKVRIRPGKPLVLGRVGDLTVVGLPGNPTSAMVTFEQFIRPAIRTMLGAPPFRPQIEVVVDERVDNRGGRQTYARIRLAYRDGRFHATLSGQQDSAMLLPLARADGLLVIPEDQTELQPGERATVEVWRLPG